MKKIKKEVNTIIKEQNALSKARSIYINKKDKTKLHEMIKDIAIDCMDLSENVAECVASELSNEWLPDCKYNDDGDVVAMTTNEPITIDRVQEIDIDPKNAELTSNPSNFSELAKCFDIIIKNFTDLKRQIKDIYYNSLTSLEANGSWSPFMESMECKLAMDDLKLLLGVDINNTMLKEMASHDKKFVVKNENKEIQKIVEWMKRKQKTTKKILISENSKLSKNKELKYWNIKLDAMSEFENKYDPKIISKAWKYFITVTE